MVKRAKKEDHIDQALKILDSADDIALAIPDLRQRVEFWVAIRREVLNRLDSLYTAIAKQEKKGR
jgi:hypothetical protein